MNLTRRQLLCAAAAAAAVAVVPAAAAQAGPFVFDAGIERPVKIASIELLRAPQGYFVRCRSSDGAEGVALTSERIAYLQPILLDRIMPFFVGKDARNLDSLLEGVYKHASNYKLAGLPFWCSVSWVEYSIIDLLGKMAGKSAGQLLGGVLRKQIPVYMSSMRRDTTPEQEVAWVGRRLQETGATAVKLKIGGRMSNNADASPGRTDRLVPLARRTFGEKVAIYVDANGSYDAARAIEVGKMLQDHNVGFFEEPCPWEDYDETRRVAAGLAMPVAGGEQDTSVWRWRDMIRTGVVDVVQPDVSYNGGFLRTIRVAEIAAGKGLPVTPHSPKADPNEAYLLHFLSRTPNIGPHHEFDAAAKKAGDWYAPHFEVKGGMLDVPSGPGLGITYDPAVLAKAEPVKA